MKKKMMSLALALVMCLSLCVPAFAGDADILVNSSSNADSVGNIMTYNLYQRENDYYVMKYYLNGKIQTEYELDGSRYINATDVDSGKYTLDSAEIIQPVSNHPMLSAYSRPIHLGNINYNKSPRYVNKPSASIEYTTSVKNGTYQITAKSGTRLSDATAVASNFIIGFALSTAYAAAASTIAGAVLIAMVSASGSSVIGGIVQAPFTKSFDCIRATYSYSVTLSQGTHIIDTASYPKYGTDEYVEFNGIKDSETYHTGYVPTNWHENDSFARQIWTDCSNYSCPGVSSYSDIQI